MTLSLVAEVLNGNGGELCKYGAVLQNKTVHIHHSCDLMTSTAAAVAVAN